MKILNSVVDTPAARPVQQRRVLRSRERGCLAWDWANRYGMSAEQSDAHGNWWGRSPTMNKRCDGTRKTRNYQNSRYQQSKSLVEDESLLPRTTWGSSPRNIDGGSFLSLNTRHYTSGRNYELQHHANGSSHWSHLCTRKASDRRSPSLEPCERPSSAFNQEFPSAKSRGKQWNQLNSWRRGERRKLH